MFTLDNTECSTKITIISSNKFEIWLKKQSQYIKNWCSSCNFKGQTKKIILVPYEDGRLMQVLVGEGGNCDLSGLSNFSKESKGNYYLETKYSNSLEDDFYIAWLWGSYSYNKTPKISKSLLYVNSKINLINYEVIHRATSFARDLINEPANILTPINLKKKIFENEQFKNCKLNFITSNELKKSYPLTYEVGKASINSPLALEISNTKINKNDNPIVIIGKGVTFDTGGLNLKPGNSMRYMKKDMGGAAIAIALFLIIKNFLKKTKIKLIIPVAENSISSNAMRPGDILTASNNKTIEITNTDAEGRLLLADALARTKELNPKLIIDFATLTGAARAALGEDLPAYYTNNNQLAKKIDSTNYSNSIWRMPLHNLYINKMKSDVADIVNASSDGMAGSITAALFLQEFLPNKKIDWIHLDTFAWSSNFLNTKGGNLQGLFAMMEFIKKNYN
jgi:leucyl aminopeptidase